MLVIVRRYNQNPKVKALLLSPVKLENYAFENSSGVVPFWYKKETYLDNKWTSVWWNSQNFVSRSFDLPETVSLISGNKFWLVSDRGGSFCWPWQELNYQWSIFLVRFYDFHDSEYFKPSIYQKCDSLTSKLVHCKMGWASNVAKQFVGFERAFGFDRLVLGCSDSGTLAEAIKFNFMTPFTKDRNHSTFLL